MLFENAKSLPQGLHITPDKFILFSSGNRKIIATIDNMTWTTYAVLVVAPKWIQCEKRFILDAQSSVEFEVQVTTAETSDGHASGDSLMFSFVDMANKEMVYQTAIKVQFHSNLGKKRRLPDPTPMLLLQLSLLLQLLTLFTLGYHFRFQVKYYLCVFQHTLCRVTRSETPLLKKILGC